MTRTRALAGASGPVRARVLMVAVALLVAACGGRAEGTGGSGQEPSGGHAAGVHGGEASHANRPFGTPGDPQDAVEKIQVSALDSLEFKPTLIRVSEGETVTFVITNEGQNPHEFLIGDTAAQEEHAGNMEHGDVRVGENAVKVAGGETKRLTWRFGKAGGVLYGCHEPGHYEGGMVGAIVVEAR